MLAEIAAELDEGKSDDSIISHFAEKYGLTVLSAPPYSGFNRTAWIIPFAALAVGGMLVIYFVRRLRAKWVAAPADIASIDVAKYQQKVDEELKKFTPED
jgi:cytochrome c-type biogenesis protein CcmH/NrfF